MQQAHSRREEHQQQHRSLYHQHYDYANESFPSSSLVDEYAQQLAQSPSSSRTQSAASQRSADSARAQKQVSLVRITVPSFAAFRSQVSKGIQSALENSPRAASFSLAEQASPRLVESTSRPYSLAAPQSHDQGELRLLPVQVDGQNGWDSRSSHSNKPVHDRTDSIESRIESTIASSAYSDSSRDSTFDAYDDYAHDTAQPHTRHRSNTSIFHGDHHNPAHDQAGASMIRVQQAPAMTVQHFDGPKRSLSDESVGGASTYSQADRPKSPIGRLGNFFGWKSPHRSEGESSPTTTFSERSVSPLPSPLARTHTRMPGSVSPSPARLTPAGLDIQKANHHLEPAYMDRPETPSLLGDQTSNAHVQELERELSLISQELAGSIRREMELEDELDRLRVEYPSAPQSEYGRRSSDYFSDSGASSARYPITDMDGQLEKLEKQVRKVEQEKANLKVEMASRLQIELGRRRDLEELLERKGQEASDRGQNDERLGEFEAALDESKRRLAQEKEAKENFEDLYSATREELEKHRNEREKETAEYQKLLYENTRMQQSLAELKDGPLARFSDTIAEEGLGRAAPRIGLSRSGSLARSSSMRRGGSANNSKDGGRQRSGSQSVAYPDGVKEIEDQRDALHKALQLLIKRHERQHRDHERAVTKLTKAREHAESITPLRSTYSREVAFLKEEVTVLRKRTEDALEQKWEYEKGLSGIKMDLDAAEQETRGLRILLQGHDITDSTPTGSDDGEARDGKLQLSITTAENERDQARRVAEEYLQRARSAPDGGQQLMGSSKRMDELADQLDAQVQSNLHLRERLAQAVTKGEQTQKESTRQIEEMQKRLAGMEDSVLAAQQHSETTLADHDAEVRRIEDADTPRLKRLQITIPPQYGLAVSGSNLNSSSRLSPHPSPLLKTSPKLLSKKLSETSLLEVSRTQMLQRKVKELEGLLREAEEDVQVVVARVNRSQMEVADLQTERDAALTQMRKLQALVVAERERAEAGMA